MALLPSKIDIRDYITQLLQIWEETPSSESALFNDEQMAVRIRWEVKRVEGVRAQCTTLGWIRHPFEGSKDYALTPAGISSGRAVKEEKNRESKTVDRTLTVKENPSMETT